MDGSSSRQPGQLAADDEIKRKEQAAMQAMMDDLGIARVNQLPLDDEHREQDRDRGNRGNGAGANNYRRHLLPQVADTNGDGPRHGNTGAAWTLDAAWRDAIAAGAFDDDDAEGVKGLDNLGGARIYDNASSRVSQVDKVTDKTIKILDQRNKRSGRELAEQSTVNKKICLNGKPDNELGRNDAPVAQKNIGQTLASTLGRSRVPPASSRATTADHTPLASAARVSLPQPSPPQPARLPGDLAPESTFDLSAPLPAGIILRTSVGFVSRDTNPAAPALVLLSVTGPPKLGFFTVVVCNRLFCQWPVCAWYDYSSGSDNVLEVSFQDGSSCSQGYELHFNNGADLREFMSTLRSIRFKNPDRVKSVSAPASAPGWIPASKPEFSETPVADSSYLGTMMPKAMPLEAKAPQMAPSSILAVPVLINGKKSVLEQDTSSSINGNGAPAPTPAVEDTHPESGDGLDQHGTSIEQTGRPEQDTLIDFSAPDVSSLTSQNPSEAAELLSTLEPGDFPSGTGDETSSTSVSRDSLMATARILLQLFLYSEAGVSTQTAGELDQTAEGIKSGMLEHVLKDAKTRGLDRQKIQEVKKVFNDIFDTEMAKRAARLTRTTTRRIQYTAEELLSMRHAAVKPPDYLANIPYLPKPGNHAQQTTISSRGTRTLPYQTAASKEGGGAAWAAFSQSQLLKSATAMQWALAENNASEPAPVVPEPVASEPVVSELAVSEPVVSRPVVLGPHVPKPALDMVSKPEPEQVLRTESEKAHTAVSSAARPEVIQDRGLQNSRWASDVGEIKHANYFTGPRYEKAWSKRSYLEDLAQLAPHTKVNAPAEDLMDFYFPMSNNDEALDGAAENQTLDSHDSQVPESGSPRPGTLTPPRTDNIETLMEGMSRLSIWSPATSRLSRQCLSSPPTQSENLTSTQPAQAVPVQSTSTNLTGLVTRFSPATPSFVPAQPSVLTVSQPPEPEPAQPPPTPPAQPSVPQTAQRVPRGLAASRHSAGTKPSTSGKFRFHVPRSALE